MGRIPRVGLAALLCVGLGFARPAAAVTLTTTIDLDYTYTQEDLGGDVKAVTQYNQKYELAYEAPLNSAFDIIGAARLSLQDAWHTSEADTSQVTPTLELQVKSSLTTAKLVYEGVITTTDPFEETAKTKTYSTNLSAELQTTPATWPQTKLKLQQRRDYQAFNTDKTTNTAEMSLVQDVSSLRLEFNLKLEGVDTVLPETTTTSDTEWSAKATYKEVLWGGTDFELAYEIKESYTKDQTRGVFSTSAADYEQELRARLKNSLTITPRMTLGVSWEYQFDQDLLALSYDYKLKNKFALDLRWDPVSWIKITGAARHETDFTSAIAGEDDEKGLTDTINGAFEVAPVTWLSFSGKAEYRSDGKAAKNSGATVDQTDEQKYDLNAKNKFGDFWELTANATASTKYVDGWISTRDTAFKSELKLKLWNLAVTPSYESTRSNEWKWGFDDPSTQSQSRDGKIRVEYKVQLLDLLTATFSHEYGVKAEDSLDDVLNFERTLQLNEDTRFNLAVAELMRNLKIEGEIERKATDTADDPDPMLVEVSPSLKLDWKIEAFSLTSSFKYNNKGNTFDDLSFNTKVGWKGERLELTGEYQFDKIYAELTDEDRKLNLKLNYKF